MPKQIVVVPQPDDNEVVTKGFLRHEIIILGGQVAKQLIKISNQIAQLSEDMSAMHANHERRIDTLEKRVGIVN